MRGSCFTEPCLPLLMLLVASGKTKARALPLEGSPSLCSARSMAVPLLCEWDTQERRALTGKLEAEVLFLTSHPLSPPPSRIGTTVPGVPRARMRPVLLQTKHLEEWI